MKFSYVTKVLARDDQHMARMELPEIHERHGQDVLAHDTDWLHSLSKSAKSAALTETSEQIQRLN